MASRGRRGVPVREGEQRRDEPRCEDQGEQQAPAPQGPVLPLPPPVDYGVFMQGLVQAMQTQAHTQAALQAQLEAQERADVWWSSLLRTWFEDGAVEVDLCWTGVDLVATVFNLWLTGVDLSTPECVDTTTECVNTLSQLSKTGLLDARSSVDTTTDCVDTLSQLDNWFSWKLGLVSTRP
ncbi:hypothetical protein Taro_039760 [Colocasia esculenta]|uniref:Uncharacterized protein n=1 Tax=Colocasia esculenta TaxID=4460 RepID=A0A843WR26_COLES|nr:hypothetical protein [Colocasia esculenta]